MRLVATFSLLAVLAASLLMAVAAPLEASVTYYVSPRGEDADTDSTYTDSHNGSDTSSVRAWKSLTYANTRVSPGTTIILMGGTHTGKVNPDPSGTGMSADSAVVYRAYTMSGNPTLT